MHLCREQVCEIIFQQLFLEEIAHEFLFAETFERELSRLQNSGFLLINGTPVQDLPSPMRSRKVRQVCISKLSGCFM